MTDLDRPLEEVAEMYEDFTREEIEEDLMDKLDRVIDTQD